jgi:hypothetical protein
LFCATPNVDETSIQKRGLREAYLNKNIPKDPSERTQMNARVESRLQDLRIEMEEMKKMLKEQQNANASKE